MANNLLYLAAAYAAVWVALLAYVFYMAGSVRSLRREVAELARLVPHEDSSPQAE